MLENLIANAIRFARGRVLVAARRRKNRMVIIVIDDGPGIAEEVRERIFETFFQAPDSQGREHAESAMSEAAARSSTDTDAGSVAMTCGYSGVGLGLSAVRRFADLLGIWVLIRSRVGHGTAIRLIMPEGDAADNCGDIAPASGSGVVHPVGGG
jgi:signal transduction histidine kinase